MTSRIKLYKLIFLFTITSFFFSYYLFGGLRLFGLPFNLVQLTSGVLLLLCLYDDGKIFIDKYVKLYVVFLIFYGISSLYTNYFDNYIQRLIRFILISYIAYWSSQKLVFKYNLFWPFLFPIILIGVFDSIVTVSQAFGSHYFDSILESIGSFDEEESQNIDIRGDLLGRSVSGIYPNPVRNGHYLLFMFAISFLLQTRRFSLIYFIPSIILLVGLFFCQQRSAFFFSILILAFLFINILG